MRYPLTLSWPWFVGAAARTNFAEFRRRDALTVEVALLANSACSLGVWVRGAIKNSTSAASVGNAKQGHAAALTFHPRSGGGVVRSDEATGALIRQTAQARWRRRPLAASRSREKGLPGKRREALTVLRATGADDLKKIKEIGPKSEERLNALGAYHFDQIPIGASTTRAGWARPAQFPGALCAANGYNRRKELAASQQRGSPP